MKPIKIIAIVVFGILIGTSGSQAQDNEHVKNLTDTQKELLQAQRELIKANREAFKASLTEAQLAILENQELTKQERHDALILTFTDAQELILTENREGVMEAKETFRATLTQEQRQHIRIRTRARTAEGKNELRESVRERRRHRRDRGGSN